MPIAMLNPMEGEGDEYGQHGGAAPGKETRERMG